MKPPSFYPRWQQYNTCLATPTITGKGHRKIEAKAKHFSHCKKNQSSWPNQTDSSERITKISNHAYKNSEKIQLIFIDKLIINPQFIGSRQTNRKKYYIEEISKNIEENMVLRVKEREEAI